MKKIDTSEIAGAAKAPYIKATHDHYKESIQETTASIIKGLLGTYTTNDIIVLYGCVVTPTIPGTSSITAGAVYYNGEIYAVDASASLITTGSQTLVWSVATTYIASDSSLTWSDGTIRDLHQIDKFVLTGAASLSGLADYNGATVKPFLKTSNIALAVGGGWVALSNTNYRKDNNGLVTISGGVDGTAATVNLIAVLPTGFRPPNLKTFLVSNDGGGVLKTAMLTIADNGLVTYSSSDAVVATNPYLWLDGISFYVD